MHPSAIGRRFNKPLCPRGHDKRVVGIQGGGECNECHKKRKLTAQRRKRRENPLFKGDLAYVNNLTQVREAFGLNKKEFANAAQISPTYVRDLEKGRRRASKRYQNLIIAAVLRLQKERERESCLKNTPK